MLVNGCCGVLSGRDRKKKLETRLLFEVLLLDQQISFEVRLFFVTRCPQVPLIACQKAQARKTGANGASFRVKKCSWSNDVFVELKGREGMQNIASVLYVGNCLPPPPSAGRTAQGMDCEDSSEKYPNYTKHPCLWCPIRCMETSKYFFHSRKICVD